MEMPRNRIVLLALIMGGCICPAVAGNLYRCVSPQGQASYQQSPRCPAGQHLDREIAYRPEPDSTPAPVVFKPALPATSHTVAVRGSSGRGKRQASASERCRAAREQRERASRKLGLRRTYADLGRLDAPVREACRW